MRLRGMSGIIIVDFVGMKDSRNRAALLDAFAAELADDRSGARIAGMTNLGLVEVTRKRARRDLTPDP
jgi:ribonuclease G